MLNIIKKFKNKKNMAIEEENHIQELKNNIEKHFKKQNLKTDELLETLIELQEINEIEKEHDILVETVIVLLESLSLISKNINDDQLVSQMDILKIKINEQLVKAKIIEISNEKEVFNIKKHEVIDAVKIEDEFHKHGEIKEVLVPGYFYKGELIKKAKIIVYTK